MTTAGGLTGRGKGNVTVSWNGALACTPPQPVCGGALPPAAVERLANLVEALAAGSRGGVTRVPCSDCYVTTLTVRRQTPDGAEIVSSYTWNDAELGGVPEPWKRLHAAIAAAALPRRQP
jgi:hypothetical protein